MNDNFRSLEPTFKKNHAILRTSKSAGTIGEEEEWTRRSESNVPTPPRGAGVRRDRFTYCAACRGSPFSWKLPQEQSWSMFVIIWIWITLAVRGSFLSRTKCEKNSKFGRKKCRLIERNSRKKWLLFASTNWDFPPKTEPLPTCSIQSPLQSAAFFAANIF